jgi:hypothetical protein
MLLRAANWPLGDICVGVKGTMGPGGHIHRPVEDVLDLGYCPSLFAFVMYVGISVDPLFV